MESRASPQNNLVIWTIPFLLFLFFNFIFDGGEHVCAWSAQCFNSLSLVWEEIALQMRANPFSAPPRVARGVEEGCPSGGRSIFMC